MHVAKQCPGLHTGGTWSNLQDNWPRKAIIVPFDEVNEDTILSEMHSLLVDLKTCLEMEKYNRCKNPVHVIPKLWNLTLMSKIRLKLDEFIVSKDILTIIKQSLDVHPE